jgi:hypothetical protein
MSRDKMQWTTPHLVVLTRGTPEESVLTFCKRIEIGIQGPTAQQQAGCQDLTSPSVCGACQARSGS